MTCAPASERLTILLPTHNVVPVVRTPNSCRRQTLSVRERFPVCRPRPTARIRLSRCEHRIFANFSLQYSRQQPRLDLQQPPVADPVFKQRVGHQRVHPHLVGPEKCFPTACGQRDRAPGPDEVSCRHHSSVHRRQHSRVPQLGNETAPSNPAPMPVVRTAPDDKTPHRDRSRHRVDAGGAARGDERGKEGDDEQESGFAEDHLQNLGPAGAHRQPDTDFAAALGDKVGDDSIAAVSAPRRFTAVCVGS